MVAFTLSPHVKPVVCKSRLIGWIVLGYFDGRRGQNGGFDVGRQILAAVVVVPEKPQFVVDAGKLNVGRLFQKGRGEM